MADKRVGHVVAYDGVRGKFIIERITTEVVGEFDTSPQAEEMAQWLRDHTYVQHNDGFHAVDPALIDGQRGEG